MYNSTTPHTLLVSHIHTLRSQLPGVRDGDPTSVHDARVATRRIRELLQFAGRPASRAADELGSQFKKMGRALGRVRDADVRIGLISGLEARMPHAAPWLVTVRHTQEHKRLRLMRRLIKRLERLGIAGLTDQMIAHDAMIHRLFLRATSTGRWRRDLCRTITSRGRTSADAIERATGVYFPNRTHTARIALKKLRYAMEIAMETGSGDLAASLRDLKKGQDVLGDLHDRQALMDDLSAAETGDQANAESSSNVVREVLEAETHNLHRRYLDRRERLLEISREAQAMRLHRGWALPSLATAGALALSSGVYVVQRRIAGARAESVRISSSSRPRPLGDGLFRRGEAGEAAGLRQKP